MNNHNLTQAVALNAAVLTVSDTRGIQEDLSGACLVQSLKQAGHLIIARAIVQDDIYQLRSIVSQWIADEKIQVILVTGGTGFSHRDNTPQALLPLFDKLVDGFGELFRHISYSEIGASTIQSRAIAGYVNKTVIFSLPGSTKACQTAWDNIIQSQLDSTHKPCNMVSQLLGKKTVAPILVDCSLF